MNNRFIYLFMLALLFSACKKSPGSIGAEIMRDCTGTYLSIEGKNYQVCNRAKTNSFNSGDKVLVSFNIAASCSVAEAACYKMLPPIENNVDVLTIRKAR